VSGEIEFLDPEPPAQPVPDTPQEHPGIPLAALGWAAAAVLAAVAPFQRLYGSGGSLPRRYADYLSGPVGGVDGWGRGGAGGVRFGVVLAVCAAIFAVLAVATALAAVRHRPPNRLVLGAVVGAPCLLAGVVVTIGLYLGADPTGTPLGWTAYAPAQNSAYGSTLTVSFRTSGTSPGWCLWLSLAALACAVFAAVAQVRADRVRRLAG
jgi:hypothetical protein